MTMTKTQAYKRYNNMLYNNVEDPDQIIAMLFAAALKETAAAERKLENGDDIEIADNINKAVEILMTLRDSIDKTTDEVTVEYLAALYDYLINKLMDGFKEKNIENIKVVARYLSKIHQIWSNTVINHKNDIKQKTAVR